MSEKRRRNVFGTSLDQNLAEVPNVPGPPAEQSPVSIPVPRSVVEQLNFAETRRSSSSSRKPRSGQVSYRGFPTDLKKSIRIAAHELYVTADEVVRATLEYSLGMYWSGKIALTPTPARMKMTLYPKSNKVVAQPTRGKKPKRKKPETPRWTEVVTYRGIPQSMQEAVKKIAEEHDIPVGEVAAYLIDHGMRAFRSGELVLQPVPKLGANTLFAE